MYCQNLNKNRQRSSPGNIKKLVSQKDITQNEKNTTTHHKHKKCHSECLENGIAYL